MVLIFRDWVHLRSHGFVGRNHGKKSQVTPPGINPGTVRLVAQRLNHYATPGPTWITYSKRNILFVHWFGCLGNVRFVKTPPWRCPQMVTETCRRFTTIIKVMNSHIFISTRLFNSHSDQSVHGHKIIKINRTGVTPNEWIRRIH